LNTPINGVQIYACGVHSKANNRTILAENPRKAEIIQEKIVAAQTEVELAAALNKKEGKTGNIILYKLHFMKTPEQEKGYLLIFPNYYDKNRIIGLGMPELSPMSLRIEHTQPNLPATCLENFHQGNKCYMSESIDGEPSQIFFENQRRMYESEIPHRHKILDWNEDIEEKTQEKTQEEKQKKKSKKSKKNKNEVLYSIYWKDGKMLKLTYTESRQLYCELYEREVLKTEEYSKLKNLLLDGFNLQICGFDAYAITKSTLEHYEDLDKPFGHELVLYTLLANECDATVMIPWRKSYNA
jgi:hypothetical protein